MYLLCMTLSAIYLVCYYESNLWYIISTSKIRIIKFKEIQCISQIKIDMGRTEIFDFIFFWVSKSELFQLEQLIKQVFKTVSI